MGVDGEGIGHVDGCTLFVKDALIGDVITAKVMKMKKNYGYARLMEILTPSPDRVEPKCAYHKQCGGCQIQALSYDKQLEYKKKKVLNNLTRIGGLTELPEFDLIGMDEPYCYRNKAQFPFGTDKNGEIVTGFYAGRTHSFISNTKCYLGVEENERILEIILAHHGELEFGSPKKPALVEAVALNFADNTDAKMETMKEIFKAAGEQNDWLGYNRLLESNIRKTSK